MLGADWDYKSNRHACSGTPQYHRIRAKVLVLLGLTQLVVSLAPCRAADKSPSEIGALRKEIEEIKKNQQTMESTLQEIKKLLQTNAAAAPAGPRANPAVGMMVNVAGKQTRGDRNAKLTLIEFTDYECPFCGRHFRETAPKILKDYIETGKIRYVFSDLPLSMHAHAKKAAEAALCAGEQGKYWEMHDLLFANQQALENSNLLAYATRLGLNVPAFQKALESGKYEPKVSANAAEAANLGFTGAPSFAIGLTQPNEAPVKIIEVIIGAQPYANFQKEFADALNPQRPSVPTQPIAVPQNPAIGKSISVEGKQFKGKKDAKLTLIQFSDYECSFCGQLARETIPQVVRDYVETGKLKFVFGDLALGVHSQAIKAAEASYCAAEQGRYWEMHDALFSRQGALELSKLITSANEIGLDMAKFQQCLNTNRYAAQVEQSSAEAKQLGFDSTPVQVLGLTERNGSSMKVMKVITGAVTYPVTQAAIENLLNSR
jgi:protein-disulfide isomerase